MIILSRRIKPWCWRCILRSGEGSSPALLLNVKPQEVVQHALAIVPAKHVDGVLVGNHRVLGAASPHKLITCRHFSPAMNCLKWPKVKSKTFSCLWPIRIELCVKWSWICHDHFRKSHFFSLITSPVGHSWGVSQSSPEMCGAGEHCSLNRSHDGKVIFNRLKAVAMAMAHHMAEQHAPAAVALQLKSIEGITFLILGLQKTITFYSASAYPWDSHLCQ